MFRQYRFDPSHILSEEIDNLCSGNKELRNKSVPLVKVLWQLHGLEEATWETEENMKSQYPNIFSGKIFGDENSFKWEEL
ncbi:Chromo domain-containing protein [Gossypium australe]|uniref:Chromo domain-containing protein n=1 Tax=Gossypium australe TaxID=47621 RepID=A0A5B6WF52_9ROSI|nr:Chromo domain-containing protein [Gossypium australe]